MSITGLITSVFMLIAPAEEVNIVGQIYKGAVLTDKVIQKTEEGSWGASAHARGRHGPLAACNPLYPNRF